MINRWVGEYRITNYLGGNPGFELYRAIRPEAPDVRYSVKRIPRDGVDPDRFVAAFAGLAQQLGALEHPKVLRMQEILFDDQAAYLLGEYLHGHPLSSLIDLDGVQPIPHAVGLFKQAAEAVAASHAVGLLHSGLTARQVLYAQQKYVKVDEFGLSALLRELGLPGGEPVAGYLAPEIAPGEPLTVAAEVFALGAVLVHLLTGHAPDPVGPDGTPVVEQLRKRRSDLPQRLLELVGRATAVEPADRFRSVDELRDLSADRSSALIGADEPKAPEPRAAGGLVQLGGLGRRPAARAAGPAAVDAPRELPALGDLPDWAVIPAGPFPMGSDRRRNEAPVHEVDLPDYEVSVTPVTNRQYRRFCDETGHVRPADPPGWGGYLEECPDHPVINVRWSDANDYCAWLSSVAGRTVRLPTEAEWEKAARGGLAGKKYPWGDEEPDGRAHFGNRAYAWEITMEGPQTRRVACFPPNGYGLYDMAGNVWEWCSDWYVPYGTRQPHAGVFRVGRGGSWSVEEDGIHCSFRMSFYSTTSDFFIGFRCVRPIQ